MGKRRQAREFGIQVLFHMEFNPGDPDDVFDLMAKHFNPPETIRAFSRSLVRGVCEKKDYLDTLIRQASMNWRLERMASVDRCILRLGIFEMLFVQDIPPKVSIDESVELGKIYGTEDSGAFINGVLDSLFNTLQQDNHLHKDEKP
jgi:transcription antitermination factor NusB